MVYSNASTWFQTTAEVVASGTCVGWSRPMFGTLIAEGEGMRTTIVLVVLSLAHLSTAHADDALQPSSEYEQKNPQVASTLSLFGSIVPAAAFAVTLSNGSDGAIAMASVGLVVGPSLGQFYAGGWGAGGLGMGIRGIGAGVAYLGLLNAFSEDDEVPLALVLGGAAITLGGVVYSFFDAPKAAHRTNKRRANIVILPTVIKDDANGRALGAQLTLAF